MPIGLIKKIANKLIGSAADKESGGDKKGARTRVRAGSGDDKKRDRPRVRAGANDDKRSSEGRGAGGARGGPPQGDSRRRRNDKSRKAAPRREGA